MKFLMCLLITFLAITGCKPSTKLVKNWNYKKNCASSQNDSIQKLSDKNGDYIRVQLRNGDIGNCPTDNNKAHSIKYNKLTDKIEATGPLTLAQGKNVVFSAEKAFLDSNLSNLTMVRAKFILANSLEIFSKDSYPRFLGKNQKFQIGRII